MATHDFRHPCSVRRTTGRPVDHLGSLTEILRAYCGWCNNTKRPRVLISVILKLMNGATLNA
jgi:hypothetical protein